MQAKRITALVVGGLASMSTMTAGAAPTHAAARLTSSPTAPAPVGGSAAPTPLPPQLVVRRRSASTAAGYVSVAPKRFVANGPEIVDDGPAAEASCPRGAVPAVIGGKRRCLKAGQRCAKRFESQYRRYGFHCDGRLTRSQPPTLPPGAKIAAKIATDALPLALTAADGSIWLAHHEAGTLFRIDPRTDAITAKIAVGSGAGGVIGAAGSIWVVRHGTTLVARIDTATNAVVQQVDVAASGPTSTLCCFPAFGADSTWVIDHDGLVVRLEPGTGRVVGRIRAGEGPSNGVVFAAGSVWGSGRNDGVVWRVDPETNQVVARVKVGTGAGADSATAPAAFGFGSVWVANAEDGTVARINAQTNEVTAKIRVSQSSLFYAGIAVDDTSVWVHDSSGYLWRIDPRTNTVVGRLHATRGSGPVLAAYGSLWIVDWQNNLLIRAEPEADLVKARAPC